MGATQHEIGFNSEQLRKARELALSYDWNATAYQIINPGIELWFSSIASEIMFGDASYHREEIARKVVDGDEG
jgi:hypothetical protein